MLNETRKYDPYMIALLVIIAVNVILKWRFFIGLSEADDFSYGVYSYSMFRLPMSWDITLAGTVVGSLMIVTPASFSFWKDP